MSRKLNKAMRQAIKAVDKKAVTIEQGVVADAGPPLIVTFGGADHEILAVESSGPLTVGDRVNVMLFKRNALVLGKATDDPQGSGGGGGGGTYTAGSGLGESPAGTFNVNAGTGLEVSADNVRIAAAAAGDGLTGGGASALAVNVDGSTIETSSDALRVKDGAITNAKVAAAAAIAYSKLNLTGAIANADIAAAAAIAYSKLNLSGSIVIGDIASSLKPSGSASATDESLRRLGTGSTHAAAGDDSRFPTAGQKNALAGTSGTPGTGNEYVTKQDADSRDTANRARANHTGTQLASTISNFDTQVRTNRLDQMAAPTAPVSVNGQRVTNGTTPTASGDLTPKEYVDSRVLGLSPHDDVVAVWTASLSGVATYNSGTKKLTASSNGAIGSGGVGINGGSANQLASGSYAVNDRVLVASGAFSGTNFASPWVPTDATSHGIYTVTSLGSAGTPWELTRATDADASAEFEAGMSVLCTTTKGPLWGGYTFVLGTPQPITMDTTALAFRLWIMPPSVDGTTLEVVAGTGKARVKADGITANEIAANAVGNSEMADNAITAAEIGNLGYGTYFAVHDVGVGNANAAPTADRVYFAQVTILHDCTITGVAHRIAGIGGNVRSALYDSTGARVANRSSALVVAAGQQLIPFDSTYAASPGVYFVAVVYSAATASVNFIFPATPHNFAAGPGSGATLTSITVPGLNSLSVPWMTTY